MPRDVHLEIQVHQAWWVKWYVLACRIGLRLGLPQTEAGIERLADCGLRGISINCGSGWKRVRTVLRKG